MFLLFIISQAYATEDIDLELPEFLSESHSVLVFSSLNFHGNGSYTAEDISLPIHLRYHRPSDVHDYDQATLDLPSVLFRCDLSNSVSRQLAGSIVGCD